MNRHRKTRSHHSTRVSVASRHILPMNGASRFFLPCHLTYQILCHRKSEKNSICLHLKTPSTTPTRPHLPRGQKPRVNALRLKKYFLYSYPARAIKNFVRSNLLISSRLPVSAWKSSPRDFPLRSLAPNEHPPVKF